MTSPTGGNLRQQEFQCHRGTLKWLATHSKAVAISARKTLANFYISSTRLTCIYTHRLAKSQ